MKNLLLFFFLFFSIFSSAQPAITGVLYPQYMQGTGNGNVSDDRKVPYACRMTVTGLTPNATYRYYNKFATSPDPLIDGSNGQGNYILTSQSGSFIRVTSASLSTVG